MLKIDIDYLNKKKKELIDGCKLCGGKNLTCECYEKFILETKKVEAMVPVKLRKYEKIEDEVNLYVSNRNTVDKYLKNISKKKILTTGEGLVITGGLDSGKSILAAVILINALKMGYSGLFITMDKYISMCMDGGFENQVDYGDDGADGLLYDKLKNVEMLVLDNLGTEYIKPGSEFGPRKLYNLLYERKDKALPTIITTTFNIKELGSIYGELLGSIIKEFFIDVKCNLLDVKKQKLETKKEI